MSMSAALDALLHHPAIWRGDRLSRVDSPSVPTGFSALDAELPGGGWPTAALTEILPQHEGIGLRKSACASGLRRLICRTPQRSPRPASISRT
jgi:protein ImuA